jgi:hypothetical protein
LCSRVGLSTARQHHQLPQPHLPVPAYVCPHPAENKRQNEKVLTYDLFLKEKQLPTSVLRVAEEVKKIKKQLSMQESEVKAILLGKYVSRHQFYPKIYAFYWDIIIGKKVMFPLSGFLKLLMVNSTQTNYQLFREQYIKPKVKVEANTIGGVTVYELNHSEAASVFYALHPDSLQPQTFKEYSTPTPIQKLSWS